MFNIREYIQKSIDTKQIILKDDYIISQIQEVADRIVECYKRDNKVLICGNGGSAADAQHFAGELVSKLLFDRPGLSALALTTDTSVLTAIGNDYGYDFSFARQVQAIGREGDVFVGISTSGNSKNVVLATLEAKKKNMLTVALIGNKECSLDKIADICIKVPSGFTPNIQESHLMIYHMICALVEDAIFCRDNKE